VKRREFLAGASAATALMQSKSIQAAQAGEADSASSMGTESNSRQAAARIPRVTHPGTVRVVQDDVALRYDGAASGLAGLGQPDSAEAFAATAGVRSGQRCSRRLWTVTLIERTLPSPGFACCLCYRANRM
jgi:hypothetical protein